MMLLVSTAAVLGLIIAFRFNRHMLAAVVVTGLAAGLGAMLVAERAPLCAINELAAFAVSVVAGFAAGAVVRSVFEQQSRSVGVRSRN